MNEEIKDDEEEVELEPAEPPAPAPVYSQHNTLKQDDQYAHLWREYGGEC